MAPLTTWIEICEDVREECSKFGNILDVKIPRPIGGSRQSAGVGKIFVKFETPEYCHKALTALAGRKFADRTVVTTYFPEVSLLTLTKTYTVLTQSCRKTLTWVLGKCHLLTSYVKTAHRGMRELVRYGK